MGSLDSLELGDVFLLFASVAIGVVLEGKLAVLLLDVVDGACGGEVEVAIVV